MTTGPQDTNNDMVVSSLGFLFAPSIPDMEVKEAAA